VTVLEPPPWLEADACVVEVVRNFWAAGPLHVGPVISDVAAWVIMFAGLPL